MDLRVRSFILSGAPSILRDFENYRLWSLQLGKRRVSTNIALLILSNDAGCGSGHPVAGDQAHDWDGAGILAFPKKQESPNSA